MDLQSLLNMAFGVAGTLLGIMLSRLWRSVDNLAEADLKLADKVQSIEVLVAGHYVRKHELDGVEARIMGRLDQIWNELKGKMDKGSNGNGNGSAK